jgi:hypothetical protein
MARLKIDPGSVDLMLTALSLRDKEEIAQAGHFAFSALGKVLAKNLPREESATNPTNFTRRMAEVWTAKELPEERKAEIINLWGEIKQYLGSKAGYIPTLRLRKIKTCVENIREIFEEHAGVNLSELLAEMTLVDRGRLQELYSVYLMPEIEGEEIIWSGFAAADFDTIFALKKTLEEASVLLRKKMDREREPIPGPVISHADYTTAYVTTAFGVGAEKGPGQEVSFRVMATNDFILAGLYIGFAAREARERYYGLIADEKLNPSLEALESAGAEFLDTFWFYNLENRLPIRSCLSREKDTDTAIRKRAEEARGMLEKTPYTWDAFLPARIWTREEACGKGAGLIEEIWKLYPGVREIINRLKVEDSRLKAED